MSFPTVFTEPPMPHTGKKDCDCVKCQIKRNKKKGIEVKKSKKERWDASENNFPIILILAAVIVVTNIVVASNWNLLVDLLTPDGYDAIVICDPVPIMIISGIVFSLMLLILCYDSERNDGDEGLYSSRPFKKTRRGKK